MGSSNPDQHKHQRPKNRYGAVLGGQQYFCIKTRYRAAQLDQVGQNSLDSNMGDLNNDLEVNLDEQHDKTYITLTSSSTAAYDIARSNQLNSPVHQYREAQIPDEYNEVPFTRKEYEEFYSDQGVNKRLIETKHLLMIGPVSPCQLRRTILPEANFENLALGNTDCFKDCPNSQLSKMSSKLHFLSHGFTNNLIFFALNNDVDQNRFWRELQDRLNKFEIRWTVWDTEEDQLQTSDFLRAPTLEYDYTSKLTWRRTSLGKVRQFGATSRRVLAKELLPYECVDKNVARVSKKIAEIRNDSTGREAYAEALRLAKGHIVGADLLPIDSVAQRIMSVMTTVIARCYRVIPSHLADQMCFSLVRGYHVFTRVPAIRDYFMTVAVHLFERVTERIELDIPIECVAHKHIIDECSLFDLTTAAFSRKSRQRILRDDAVGMSVKRFIDDSREFSKVLQSFLAFGAPGLPPGERHIATNLWGFSAFGLGAAQLAISKMVADIEGPGGLMSLYEFYQEQDKEHENKDRNIWAQRSATAEDLTLEDFSSEIESKFSLYFERYVRPFQNGDGCLSKSYLENLDPRLASELADMKYQDLCKKLVDELTLNKTSAISPGDVFEAIQKVKDDHTPLFQFTPPTVPNFDADTQFRAFKVHIQLPLTTVSKPMSRSDSALLVPHELFNQRSETIRRRFVGWLRTERNREMLIDALEDLNATSNPESTCASFRDHINLQQTLLVIRAMRDDGRSIPRLGPKAEQDPQELEKYLDWTKEVEQFVTGRLIGPLTYALEFYYFHRLRAAENGIQAGPTNTFADFFGNPKHNVWEIGSTLAEFIRIQTHTMTMGLGNADIFKNITAMMVGVYSLLCKISKSPPPPEDWVRVLNHYLMNRQQGDDKSPLISKESDPVYDENAYNQGECRYPDSRLSLEYHNTIMRQFCDRLEIQDTSGQKYSRDDQSSPELAFTKTMNDAVLETTTNDGIAIPRGGLNNVDLESFTSEFIQHLTKELGILSDPLVKFLDLAVFADLKIHLSERFRRPNYELLSAKAQTFYRYSKDDMKKMEQTVCCYPRQERLEVSQEWTENQLTEDQLTEDQLTEDQLTEDQLTEDQLTEDQLTEDQLTEDQLTEDQLTEDQLTEDQLTEDQLTEDQLAEAQEEARKRLKQEVDSGTADRLNKSYDAGSQFDQFARCLSICYETNAKNFNLYIPPNFQLEYWTKFPDNGAAGILFWTSQLPTLKLTDKSLGTDPDHS